MTLLAIPLTFIDIALGTFLAFVLGVILSVLWRTHVRSKVMMLETMAQQFGRDWYDKPVRVEAICEAIGGLPAVKDCMTRKGDSYFGLIRMSQVCAAFELPDPPNDKDWPLVQLQATPKRDGDFMWWNICALPANPGALDQFAAILRKAT